eukprot:363941-Chlamydomonas_euryale.AAC.22
MLIIYAGLPPCKRVNVIASQTQQLVRSNIITCYGARERCWNNGPASSFTGRCTNTTPSSVETLFAQKSAANRRVADFLTAAAAYACLDGRRSVRSPRRPLQRAEKWQHDIDARTRPTARPHTGRVQHLLQQLGNVDRRQAERRWPRGNLRWRGGCAASAPSPAFAVVVAAEQLLRAVGAHCRRVAQQRANGCDRMRR